MKLRTRLLCSLVPIVLLALVTLGYVVYDRSKDASSQALEQQMALALEQSEREFRHRVDTLRATLALLVNSDLVRRYAATEDEGERIDLLQPSLLRHFLNYGWAYPDYREIRFVLTDGYEDTRVTNGPLANVTEEEADSPWFERMSSAIAADPDQPFLTFEHSPDDGKPVLLGAQAVYVSTDGLRLSRAKRRLAGYLTVSVSMEAFIDAISSQRIGRTGRMALFDDLEQPIGTHAETIVDRRNLATFEEQRPSSRRNAGYEPVERAAPANRVTLERSADLEGGIVAYALVPAEEFAVIKRSLAFPIAAVSAVSIAILSALLFLVLKSQVIDPLARLSNTARLIGEGRDEVVPDSIRDDEIGALTDAFKNMHVKLLGSMRELTESHDRIAQLAFTDSLTGLPNRRAFLDLVDSHLREGGRHDHRAVLMFLDLDGFKRINDTLGHEAGDQLLIGVARRLAGCVGERIPAAAIGRLGGDEFTLLLPDADLEEAITIARQIRDELREPIEIGGDSVVVGTSIGIASHPNDAIDATTLLKNADVAMYEAKRQGPNNYRLYRHAMHEGLKCPELVAGTPVRAA